MFKKLTILSVLLASVAVQGTAVFASDEYNVSSGITAVGAPLALHGVDPVAFIHSGRPVEGAAELASTHDGAAYYFSTAENKKAFDANPEAFLPQNGGFCTFGVSVGKKFDGDPSYAAVIDKKLYVFLNKEVFDAFNKNRAGTIANASDQWSQIRSVEVAEL